MTAERGRILDVGCGQNKIPGSVGIDRVSLPDVDVVHDLDTYPWPFPDNSFDEIRLSQVIEHLKDVLAVMEELHRIGRPGARISIYTPHFSSFNSWTDPTHRQHLGYRSFEIFSDGRRYNYTKSSFKLSKRRITFGKGMLCLPGKALFHMSPEIYEKYFCFIFPAKDVEFELEVEK